MAVRLWDFVIVFIMIYLIYFVMNFISLPQLWGEMSPHCTPHIGIVGPISPLLIGGRCFVFNTKALYKWITPLIVADIFALFLLMGIIYKHISASFHKTPYYLYIKKKKKKHFSIAEIE